MPRKPFNASALPSFDEAPSVVLVAGALDFFVEEAASKVAEALAKGGAERIRFDEDAPPEAVSDALLNRSLFSPQRVVELDVSRLLGTESPGALLDGALKAWQAGTPSMRREAFRKARVFLSALHLDQGADPAETAEKASRKVKRSEGASLLTELLREMPEQKGPPDLFLPALRTILERGNDGVVALLTATAPPRDAALLTDIARQGLVFEVPVGEKESPGALARYAQARAREREVTLESGAVERLLVQTDGRPELFASELAKLLEWAGHGERVRAEDVRAQVDDESSESLYELYDAIGRRDAGDALERLQRLFSGRTVRMGKGMGEIDTEEYWPTRFLGFLTGEIRRMLLLRSLLDDPAVGYDAGMSPATFEARVLPRLLEARGRSGKPIVQGKAFGVFKLAERSARFHTEELARALVRGAEVDVQLKSSTPPLDALSAYVGRLIAGD